VSRNLFRHVQEHGRLFSAAFAHVWTVRGDKLVRFDMHTDTAKVIEAMQG
jgi:ketosteroid isomerase-like protein